MIYASSSLPAAAAAAALTFDGVSALAGRCPPPTATVLAVVSVVWTWIHRHISWISRIHENVQPVLLSGQR